MCPLKSQSKRTATVLDSSLSTATVVDSVMFGVSSWRESLICVYVNKQV